MNDGLIDAFRHSAWATRGLLDFCRRLDDDQLNQKAIGAYGSILGTLRHLIGGELFYSLLFTGSLADWGRGWVDDAPTDLDQLVGWAADMESVWEGVLGEPFDAEVILHEDFGDGSSRDVRAGIVLAQVLHHGNAHREQVATILTTLGFEPPDLDVWEYGRATGRNIEQRAST